MMLRSRSVIFVLLANTVLASAAWAVWPNDPQTNLAVRIAPYDQNLVVAAPDGEGGAILAWVDVSASGTYHEIRAQHVLRDGQLDPAWPSDSRVLSGAVSYKGEPAIVSNGAGGAIVFWTDNRTYTYNDLYAQRVNPDGSLDSAWPVDGLAVCVAPVSQLNPAAVSDGAGGAIVSWLDSRSGSGYDIYVQRVRGNGIVDPGWPTGGRALSLGNFAERPAITSDSSGGAIVCWSDRRIPFHRLYAQRVSSAGTTAWQANGVPLCVSARHQWGPAILTDGSGGIFVAFQDDRRANFDIYSQHLQGNGVVDPAWPDTGLALETSPDHAYSPSIVSDKVGGAIVAWYGGPCCGGPRVFAHHFFGSGVVDPAWPAEGRLLCVSDGVANYPQLYEDGGGGAIAVWKDNRWQPSALDVFSQRVLHSGALDPRWPVAGLAVSSAMDEQWEPSATSDGNGGVIVAWSDRRNGSDRDIYAQRVGPTGDLGIAEPQWIHLRDVSSDQGGVLELQWRASDREGSPVGDVARYVVLRSSGSGMDSVASVVPDGSLHYSCEVTMFGDSTGAGSADEWFVVVARSSAGAGWESLLRSGHSVDNLAPAMPAGFGGTRISGVNTLHWNANAEGDIAGYRLYRGAEPDFPLTSDHLIASPADTGYAESASEPWYYRLTAVDVHGNESLAALMLLGGTTSVGSEFATRVFLDPPSPNPATSSIEVRFGTDASSSMHLNVFDAAGRNVRTLSRRTSAPGAHSVEWDLRAANGRRVEPGVYFLRLAVAGQVRVRTVIVSR